MIIAYGLFGIFANIALLVNLIMLIARDELLRLHHDAARHRRHRAHHGHGGRLQRHHLRAHARGVAQRPLGPERHRDRLQVGLRARSSTPNFTTLIAAVVLFGVGSGPVKGFAVTHAIGILTTMFTAYTVTRYIVALWVGWAKPKEVPL